ncbi:hypothetical protein EDD86DRAFT_245986 [Gorgonomyces haynaldii]|nr:hypothetical protein EDD86DRAFT_245986 [Gorgonomyces haynaldii]
MIASTAVGSSLLVTFLIDFGIQLVFYIYSAINKTERFYDLSGALTYQACILVALLYRQGGESLSTLGYRQIVTSVLGLVWCTRLGWFLFERVTRVGEDKRFEELKQDPAKFAIPWFLQVVWIFLTAFPIFTLLGNPANTQPGFIASDVVGIVIWVFGFGFEVIADYQKNAFKTLHPSDFVSTGVWKYSRYANYFGEVTLWVGMFILCAGGFVENWQFVTVISPVFVFCLIYFVSGVALSEPNAEKRYGARQDYQEYKAKTSKFIPWFPKPSRTIQV